MLANLAAAEAWRTAQDGNVIRKLILLSLLIAPMCIAQDEQKSHPPGIELPEGEGKVLLLTACTRCHDLKGLPAYRGYWDAIRWRAMIDTMIKNGASLDARQAGTLADYLAQHFGKTPPLAE